MPEKAKLRTRTIAIGNFRCQVASIGARRGSVHAAA
jgi:hypothetical protein